MGVGDDHVHHAVRGERGVPGEGLVDAQWRSVVLHQQVFRSQRIAQMRAVQRRGRGRTLSARLACGLGCALTGLG